MPLRIALALVALLLILPAHYCAAQDANQPPPASNGVSTWSCISTSRGRFRIYSKDENFKCYCQVRTPAAEYSWTVDSGWKSGFGCKGFCTSSPQWQSAKSAFKQREDQNDFWVASTVGLNLEPGFLSLEAQVTLPQYSMYNWMNRCESEAWPFMGLARFIPSEIMHVSSFHQQTAIVFKYSF